MPQPTARERFFSLLRTALADGTLTKLTLGKHRGADSTLNNLFIRPVVLKTGPHLSFVYRHATRDITKNHPPADADTLLEKLIGTDFRDAHLFTTTQTAQLSTADDGTARISIKAVKPAAPPITSPGTTADPSASHPAPLTLHSSSTPLIPSLHTPPSAPLATSP